MYRLSTTSFVNVAVVIFEAMLHVWWRM